MAKRRRKQSSTKSSAKTVAKKLEVQRKLINALDPTKFTPAQARRFATMKKQFKSLKEEFKVIRESELEAAKERYAAAHKNLQTIKDRLTNQEINQAIRFLHDKGIIRSSNQYYEDFLELNEDKWSIDEIRDMLNEYEEGEKQALEDTLTLITDGYYTSQPLLKKNDFIFG